MICAFRTIFKNMVRLRPCIYIQTACNTMSGTQWNEYVWAELQDVSIVRAYIWLQQQYLAIN